MVCDSIYHQQKETSRDTVFVVVDFFFQFVKKFNHKILFWKNFESQKN